MQTRGTVPFAQGVLHRVAAAGPIKERPARKKVEKVVQRTCKRCGKDFPTTERRQKYCALECATEARADKYRAEINALIAAGKVPSTRMEASFLGAKFYFTGQPCANGHIDVRTTNTKNCVICSREKHRRDNEIKAGKRQSRPKPVKVAESVQTSAVFLHLLWDWRPVVVAL
jgi:hypothetical protein